MFSAAAALISWGFFFSRSDSLPFYYSLFPAADNFAPATSLLITATSFTMLLVFLAMLSYYRYDHNKKLNQHIYQLAYTDRLIGCSNFDHFCLNADKLTADLAIYYSCVSIDIDNFKLINEIKGYAYGDTLLRRIASSLQNSLRPNEIFCRFQEDAFSMLLITEPEPIMKRRITDMLRTSATDYSAAEITPFTFSCGIYHIKNDCSIKTAHDYSIVARNTLINYHKELCDFAFFDDSMHSKIVEKKYFENELYKSIDNDEFVIYFQPKYSIAPSGDRLNGAEALVRWIHHEKGFLSPGVFIPIFEETGQIVTLDLHIFTKVCQQLHDWLDDNKPVVPVSVNISRVTLLSNPNLDVVLTATAAHYEIPPSLISLEITETANCNIVYFSHLLDNLKKNGFTISMDDFGSGYSSFDLLHKLPLDTLKLDKTFFDFWTDTNKEKAKGIIRAAVNMSKDLNMTTVAEGAELKEQIDFLKSIHCDMVQSYYFAKPMPATDFARLLADD